MSFLLTKFNKAKEQYRWLNYEICSDLEALCNGKIIELVDWIDFLNWFNLRNTEEEIKPRHMCTRKVQGLIHILADYIHADKDVARYVDRTVYPKWSKLDEETLLLKLLSLSSEKKINAVKETWEKHVVEKASIPYDMHKKHRDAAMQTSFIEGYRKQSKKDSAFMEEISRILQKYPKFEPLEE